MNEVAGGWPACETREMLRIVFSALVVGLTAGCGADDRPATWSYIHAAIVVPSCTTASCHSREAAVAYVDLHERELAYATLLGRDCDTQSDAPGYFVDPGHPESSHLIRLLRNEDVSVPMPPDRLLGLRDIELVEAWIAGGAACE